MSDPAARSPRGGSAGPAPQETAAGGPRAAGDAIAVDISTRAGLVTVQFTGRGHARACPAAGRAFTYRGRQYTGSVFCSGPGWHESAGLGLSLGMAGVPAGQSVADTIAAIIGAAVAAYVRAHPEVLDLAAQAPHASRPGQGRTRPGTADRGDHRSRAASGGPTPQGTAAQGHRQEQPPHPPRRRAEDTEGK